MSYYFNSLYPTINYDPTGNGITKEIQDILIRVIARSSVIERKTGVTKYTVKDGDSPELLANRLYGSPKYYWVILLVNKIYDRYYEWPMSTNILNKYILDKYSDPNAIHHYEIAQSSGDSNVMITVELADEPTATPITNFEYEEKLNEKRKRISLLNPSYLSQFETEYLSLIKEFIL